MMARGCSTEVHYCLYASKNSIGVISTTGVCETTRGSLRSDNVVEFKFKDGLKINIRLLLFIPYK